jgi:hypothetical protein
LVALPLIPWREIHVSFSPKSRVSVAATLLFHGMIGVPPENEFRTFAQAAVNEQNGSSFAKSCGCDLGSSPFPIANASTDFSECSTVCGSA